MFPSWNQFWYGSPHNIPGIVTIREALEDANGGPPWPPDNPFDEYTGDDMWEDKNFWPKKSRSELRYERSQMRDKRQRNAEISGELDPIGYEAPEIGEEVYEDDEDDENFEQESTLNGNIYPDIPIDVVSEEKEEMVVPRIEVQPESKEVQHIEHQVLHAAIMQESVPGDNLPIDVVGPEIPDDPIHPDLQGGGNVAPILAPVAPRLARARDKVAVLIAASLALASKNKRPLQGVLAASTGLAIGMAYAWAYEKTVENKDERKTPATAVYPEPEETYDPVHKDGGNEMFSYRPISVKAPPPKVSKYVPKHKRVVGAMDRMVAGLSGVQPWMKASKYRIPMQRVEKKPLSNFKLLAMQKKKRKKS